MKRAPYPKVEDTSGKRLWRSLGELEKSPEIDEKIETEFEPGASEPPKSGLGRRGFLGIMGASLALAGLTGCRRPEEKILPYVHAPEEVIPGRPLHFATAMPWIGGAVGLVVESHEGRPTKIEGNPHHPGSRGGTSTFAQASVLELYDPDRSKNPREKGQEKKWEDAIPALRALAAKHKANGGEGLAILTEAHRSPSLKAALARLQEAMPKARVVRWEPLARHAEHEGTKLAFGRPVDVSLDLAEARVIVSLDADFLLTDGPMAELARGFAAGRDVEKRKEDLSRLYVVESSYSATGATADHRLRMKSRDIAKLATALAVELATTQKLAVGDEIAATKAPQLDDRAQKWVRAMAKDLAKNRGRAVIVAGRKQPAAVHALAQLMNVALDASGKVVHYRPAFDEAGEGPEGVVALTKAGVKTLVILGGNPAFDAPADAKFADFLKSVETSVHLSSLVDETSELATWHLNRAHYLEAWGDSLAADGTAAVVQPLVAPLYHGKSDLEIVEILGGGERKGYEIVRETWKQIGGATLDFEHAFRKALREGVVEGSTPAELAVTPDAKSVAAAIAKLPADAQGFEVTLEPDPHAWDGRFANNGWMQEVPDSMHRMTWGNAAAMSPKTAQRLGVSDGDVVAVKAGGTEVRVPTLVAPGHAEDSITLTVGQGRKVGTVATGVGVDTYPLRRSDTRDVLSGATVERTGDNTPLARTQEHFLTAGRPMILETTAAKYAEEPEVEREKHLPLLSLWHERSYTGMAWGMTIDLNQCIGCNACAVACYAENNIPVVGAEGVMKSREMAWIRVDRYFESEEGHPDVAADEPEAHAQPLMCNHCENAPCEEVCPVGATTHSPEGLNEMAYNRCIGTKYCGNNCPFKVRRFNFFNYAKNIPEAHRAQFNPDVTVRSRGVMEKCTFCVQRINHAKIDAQKEGRDRLHDGEVRTACQQACPANAIHFGDLNDPTSEVAMRAKTGRAYKMLEELNVKPRVSYLARIKNPNPELVGA